MRDVAFNFSSVDFSPHRLASLESMELASALESTKATWETEGVRSVTYVIGREGKLSRFVLSFYWTCGKEVSRLSAIDA